MATAKTPVDQPVAASKCQALAGAIDIIKFDAAPPSVIFCPIVTLDDRVQHLWVAAIWKYSPLGTLGILDMRVESLAQNAI